MLKWFTLKNKEGGKFVLPPFIYFYSVTIVALDGFTPRILSIVLGLQPTILIVVNEVQPLNILLIVIPSLIFHTTHIKFLFVGGMVLKCINVFHCLYIN